MPIRPDTALLSACSIINAYSLRTARADAWVHSDEERKGAACRPNRLRQQSPMPAFERKTSVVISSRYVARSIRRRVNVASHEQNESLHRLVIRKVVGGPCFS